MLNQNKILSTVIDISCDPTGPYNPLPIYETVTTFNNPSIKLGKKENPVDLIAIDHLSSFLPKESSIDFSTQLFPFLCQLNEEKLQNTVWEKAKRTFEEKLKNSSPAMV